jgi:NhaP-type Na+/H+ and K+/H+ antiporter
MEDLVEARFGALTNSTTAPGLDFEGNLLLRSVIVAVVAAVVLLVLRPPFVLTFTYDSERPWNTRCEISWTSILAAVSMVVAVSLVQPLLA